MKLAKSDAVPGGRYHNHKDFMNFPEIGKKEHYYTNLPPSRHKDLPPFTSILKMMRQKDILLHFPYHTFNHVLDFLREAAIDPQVKEIGLAERIVSMIDSHWVELLDSGIGTAFWVDRTNVHPFRQFGHDAADFLLAMRMTVIVGVVMTQRFPGDQPFANHLQTLTYQALDD